jgi:predicted DNA-binding protein
MQRRKQGYKAHGTATKVRGTRLSLELDSRVQALASLLGVSMSQIIAECVLAHSVVLEHEHNINATESDCDGKADSIQLPQQINKAKDNNEQ